MGGSLLRVQSSPPQLWVVWVENRRQPQAPSAKDLLLFLMSHDEIKITHNGAAGY